MSALSANYRSSTAAGQDTLPHIVIVGAGFAGLAAAKGLAKAPVKLTIIDRQNHHLFQPLLYQVATAGLSPAQIATPIRSMLARQQNATVLMETVQAIDPCARLVTTCSRELAYDFLIVATGATHAYFGNEEWARHAPGLKTISDATLIRTRILTAFEKAEAADSPHDCERRLTFIVVGAGATGVEMAGAIAELTRHALAHDFRNIDPSRTRILLVEGGERVLPAFTTDLSSAARAQLQGLGVEVLTGAMVKDVNDSGVVLASGEVIASSCVVWAAGVKASPAGSWLGAKVDRAGRVLALPDLTITGHPEIFVIGDTASVAGSDGRPVPGVAPAAKQMGEHVARSIKAKLARKPASAFVYKDSGSLATIGRKSAVATIGPLRLTGLPAWLVWSFVHLWFLVGHRNRFAVFLDWAWSYFTLQRGARLITGQQNG